MFRNTSYREDAWRIAIETALASGSSEQRYVKVSRRSGDRSRAENPASRAYFTGDDRCIHGNSSAA